MNSRLARSLLVLAALCVQSAFAAGPAPFDLTGPSLEVTVSGGNVTLPIAQASHLAG